MSYAGLYLMDKDLRFTFVDCIAIQHMGDVQDGGRNMTPWDLRLDYREQDYRQEVQPLTEGAVTELNMTAVHKQPGGGHCAVRVTMCEARAGYVAVVHRTNCESLVRRARIKLENEGQTASIRDGMRDLGRYLQEDAEALSRLGSETDAREVRERLIHYCGWLRTLPTWLGGQG